MVTAEGKPLRSKNRLWPHSVLFWGGFIFPVSELITSRYDAPDHDGEEGEGAGAQPADDLLYGKLV